MRMEGGGASKGMRGEEKEEGEDPKASADPAGNQGREGENKQCEGKGWGSSSRANPPPQWPMHTESRPGVGKCM